MAKYYGVGINNNKSVGLMPTNNEEVLKEIGYEIFTDEESARKRQYELLAQLKKEQKESR